MGNRKFRVAVCVAIPTFLVCILLGMWKQQNEPVTSRVWQHEQEKDANPDTGKKSLPADFLTDSSFETHLPLVIIDTGGKEIINYKYYDEDSDAMIYPEGVDVYTQIKIAVIDNEDHVNSPEDSPAHQSFGKIKVRGNHSALLSKWQYRIKLLDEEGQKLEAPLLGMEASNDWILNGTQSDRSYLRTYLAMNLAGSVQECTPDIRYCELLIKEGDVYKYQGLYMLMEPVARGEGRVEIEKYDSKELTSSYILRRDRYDEHDVMLDTYLDYFPGKRKEWDLEREKDAMLAVVYPKEDVITDATVSQIETEISQFEEVLYSDDLSTYLQYRNYIDMSSFCDYFIINEFLASYDAGIHSTYMYKNVGGKLTAGPIWDFDGGMDNVTDALTRYDYIVMGNRPWFEQMVKDQTFVEMLNTRYRHLREGLLSEESINQKIDDIAEYLGNAILRDTQRWEKEYNAQLPAVEEEDTKLMIYRNDGTYEKAVRRLKNFLTLHGRYMDENLEFVKEGWDNDATPFVFPAAICIIIFFVSTILVVRTRKI
ncbi:CotH kinase family protein [Blautia schinkii]|nr:CotH kinase family protein [Blautia schinkii]